MRERGQNKKSLTLALPKGEKTNYIQGNGGRLTRKKTLLHFYPWIEKNHDGGSSAWRSLRRRRLGRELLQNCPFFSLRESSVGSTRNLASLYKSTYLILPGYFWHALKLWSAICYFSLLLLFFCLGLHQQFYALISLM